MADTCQSLFLIHFINNTEIGHFFLQLLLSDQHFNLGDGSKIIPLPHAKKSGNIFDSNQNKISCVLGHRFLSLEKSKSIILMLKKIS